MQNNKAKKIIGIFLAFFILVTAVVLDYYSFYDFPNEIRIIEGKQQEIKFKVPLTFQLFCDQSDFLTINGNRVKDKLNLNLKDPVIIQSSKLGTYNLEFRLLGIIPVKKMTVHVLPEIRVIPGGHSIGVKLRPNGVIVVGFASVVDENGQRHYPAQEAGIEIGDTIYMVNHHKIYQADELSRIVNNDEDKTVVLSIKRNDRIIETSLKAVKNDLGMYQIGLWVRDITAGVGTLTFYDPETGFYGALGHIISDADTGKTIEIGEGEIIRARVTSIAPGRKSQPGEKRGIFIHEDRIIGNILANTSFGIFGKAYYPFQNPYYGSLPIAPVTQVHEGKANILTVINGEKIEKYDIEIQKIFRQAYPNGKGMIIKVCDPELIARTGGIIQGMSGSPIIQDGYLVGAVTHVFVNDPTKGYGVFAEWMIEEVSKLQSGAPVMKKY
ncbi:MAG TPA: SpoIVB peptidase [Thermoanaerobacterales bacterium]|nr:SpoIVB peptidase [Thermoanaerobacterales bacterium]